MAWADLRAMLVRCNGKPERLGPTGALRLGELYRSTAADLAQARQQFGTMSPVTHELDGLVTQARQAVYAHAGRSISPVRFFATRYWQLLWDRRQMVMVACLIFFFVTALALYWGISDPRAARGLVPGWAIDPTDPVTGDRGMSASQSAVFSSEIFTNNIGVTLLEFVGGLTVGILTLISLVYNCLMLGAIFGIAIEHGNGGSLYELIVAHGVIELSCIVIACATGFSIAKSILIPGGQTRRQSLVEEMREAVLIVLGTAPWLVIAGLLEGYVSPAGLGMVAVTVVGFTVGGIYWALIYFRGRINT